MSKNSMVLVVDGPARGRVREVESTSFRVYEEPLLGGITTNAVTDKPIMYYVHPIHLVGFVIFIASIQTNVDAISPYDLIELLLSDQAKQAIIQA